jgi:hypothetical protein
MKKTTILIFSLFIFSLPIFGQVNDEIDINGRQIPYDEVNVAFTLDGTPTPEDVGFDNPKSSWKFTYELRFLNDVNTPFEIQEKIYAKYENQGEKTKWLPKANKLIDKETKKMSILITKGRIKKSSLFPENNREILMPIKLTRQIQEIIAASAGSNQNPEFIIYVKGKLSTKTTSKLKFKEKYSIRFPCPVKIQSSDRKIYWALNRCGVSMEAVNQNNKIRFGLFSRL